MQRELSTVAVAVVVALAVAASGVGCGAKVASSPRDGDVGVDLTTVFDFTTVPADGGSGDATPATDDGGAPPDVAFVDEAPMPVDLGPPPDATAPPDGVHVAADLAAPDLAKAPVDLGGLDLAGFDLACPGACDKPPAAKCEGAAVRSYGAGSCQSGACSYPSALTSCPKGCYQAKCLTESLGEIQYGQSFVSGTGAQVGNVGGSAPSTDTVTIVTRTQPPGAAKQVGVVYSVNDPKFGNGVSVPFTLDSNQPVMGQQQWFALIPKQPKGAHVYWYIVATGFDGTSKYYSNFGNNFDYTTY